MKKKNVQIIESQEIFNKFVFRIKKARLRHERFDGTMSDEMVRLNLDRGDSVAALLHDQVGEVVIMAEQFRYPTYEKGPGWLLELPAGIVEPGEEPETCARREITEEVGYEVGSLSFIATVYMSPGGSSERIHIYYASVTSADQSSSGGGVAGEGEDIRIVNLPTSEALRMAATGEIIDAKTLIALQWLQIQRG